MDVAFGPFPLDVAIWGTVAAWVGSIVTSASFAFAAYVFFKNSSLDAKSQARHIRFVHLYWTSDGYHTQISNYSDKSIFEVTPNRGRKYPFREVLRGVCEGRYLADDEVQHLRSEWESTSGGETSILNAESSHLGPGVAREFAYNGTKRVTEWYWLEFRDAMGRKWKISLDGTDPVRIREGRSLRNSIRHPRLTIAALGRRRKLNRWLDENS